MKGWPKNTVFVYYYSMNTGNAPYYAGNRCVVAKTFDEVYAEMERDVNYFQERYGATVLSQWVNNNDINKATSTSVALEFPADSEYGRMILDLHITPAVP